MLEPRDDSRIFEMRRKVEKMASSSVESDIRVFGREGGMSCKGTGGERISLAASLSQAVGRRDKAFDVTRSVLA